MFNVDAELGGAVVAGPFGLADPCKERNKMSAVIAWASIARPTVVLSPMIIPPHKYVIKRNRIPFTTSKFRAICEVCSPKSRTTPADGVVFFLDFPL